MNYQMDRSASSKQSLPKLLLLFGSIGIILCICFCVISISGVFIIIELFAESPSTIQATPDARIIISVTEDSCHVERTDLKGSSPVNMLTWVITDLNGDVLLERNAEGEYRYGYFRSGTYIVYMKGWYEGRYYQISNEVRVECP